MVGGVQLNEDRNSATDDCNFSAIYYDNLDAISLSPDTPRKTVYDFAKDPYLSGVQETTFLGNDALTGVSTNEHISLKTRKMYVYHNKHLYDISYILVNGKKTFKTDILEKIISTFKFTK